MLLHYKQLSQNVDRREVVILLSGNVEVKGFLYMDNITALYTNPLSGAPLITAKMMPCSLIAGLTHSLSPAQSSLMAQKSQGMHKEQAGLYNQCESETRSTVQ